MLSRHARMYLRDANQWVIEHGDGKRWEATGEIVTDEEARARAIEGGASRTLEWEAAARLIRVLPCAEAVAQSRPARLIAEGWDSAGE